jgi:hypothetical protein
MTADQPAPPQAGARSAGVRPAAAAAAPTAARAQDGQALGVVLAGLVVGTMLRRHRRGDPTRPVNAVRTSLPAAAGALAVTNWISDRSGVRGDDERARMALAFACAVGLAFAADSVRRHVPGMRGPLPN